MEPDKKYRSFAPGVMLNSFFIFLSVSSFVQFAYYLMQALTARLFGIRSMCYFNGLNFGNYSAWSMPKVLIIYILPIIFALALSVAGYLAYVSFRREKSVLRIWFLWLHICGLCTALSAFVQGAVMYRGFAVVLMWMSLPAFLNKLMAALALGFLLIIATFWGMFFLKLCPSKDFEVNRFPHGFLLQSAILPAFFGATVIAFVNLRDMELSAWIGLLLPLTALTATILSARPDFNSVLLVKDTKTDRLHWLSAGLGVFAVFCTWLMFEKGIYV